jgi:hypothetical protein
MSIPLLAKKLANCLSLRAFFNAGRTGKISNLLVEDLKLLYR